jgi:hypothetical protein
MSRRWTPRRRGSSTRCGHDGGQIVPLASALVGLCCVALLSLVPVARTLDDRARARTAADAAALAGAADSERTAREVAVANGADLLEIERNGDEVVVQVRVGEVEAYARARATPRPVDAGAGGPAGTAGGNRAGLAPAMLAALARADGLLGRSVTVVSGLRSRSQQQVLWERRATNPYPVARPGTSDHERGLAIDVPRAEVADLRRVARAAGLCQPLPVTDPIHFIVCGS